MPACGHTDLYPKNGRCRTCAKAQRDKWKKANKAEVKKHKAAYRLRKLLSNRRAVEIRIANLRREADYLERLLVS